MDSVSNRTWKLDVALNDHDIFSVFSAVFETNVSSPTTSKFTFLDDFDSHLWAANYLLYKNNGQQYKLVSPAGDVRDINASSEARFWRDFSEEKSVLRKLIGSRAVMPVTSLQLIERNYSLCNEDKKVVVKACLTQVILENNTVSYITLQALRGYKKNYAQAQKIIASSIKAEISNFGLKFILLDNSLRVFENNKKSEIPISADMPTEDCVRAIALGLLNASTGQVEGMVDDIDTDFLHQFRVNLRKLRSLISLLKKSLPHTTVEMLKPRLSSAARKTNALRDLDVFLLDEDRYRELLPDNFSNGLSELYVMIRKQREEEQKKVSGYFSSENHRKNIEACAKELSLSPAYETDLALQPVLGVAKKLLLNRYHKMLASSAKIDSQSADEDIHALRIEFKKFRYLIDFFISLLPKKDLNALVAEVKKIQGVLGNFNDYSVQVRFLKNYIDDDRIEMSKSLCGLIGVLHQKQIAERRKVNDILANFFTEKMTSKIDVLFG